MEPKTISLCVLSFNGVEILPQCLESLSKQKGNFNKIITVCDNGSTDGTHKILLENFKKCRIIQNKTNQSFTSSFNRMINSVDADYYGIISNDIVFKNEDSIQKIINLFNEKKSVGMIAPKSIRPDGVLDNIKKNEYSFWEIFKSFTLVGNLLKIVGKKKHNSFLNQNISSTSEVLQDSSLFIKKEILNEKFFFDESFKFYFTEDQISIDCRRKNFELFYTTKIKVNHLHQHTMNKMKVRSNWYMLKDAMRYSYIYHNKFLTILVLYPLGLISFPIKLLYWFLTKKI